MIPNLTEEQREALRRAGGALEVRDDVSDQVYVIAESELFHQAMQALKEREDADAIRAGIADMESGRVVSFAEVDARIRSKLGLPPRDR